jgi:hypothetical protein
MLRYSSKEDMISTKAIVDINNFFPDRDNVF